MRPARSRVSSTLIDAAGYPRASRVAPLPPERRTASGALPAWKGSWEMKNSADKSSGVGSPAPVVESLVTDS